MAKQKMVRVDYRLIHGQIVAKWIKSRPIDRIIVADDQLNEDEFMSDIYRMAVPGKNVDIIKLEDLKFSLEKNDDSVMIIFRNIENAYKSVQNGVVLNELNIGAVESAKGRLLITSGVSLSKNEYETLTELKSKGINVYIQPIPENNRLSLENIQNKFR